MAGIASEKPRIAGLADVVNDTTQTNPNTFQGVPELGRLWLVSRVKDELTAGEVEYRLQPAPTPLVEAATLGEDARRGEDADDVEAELRSSYLSPCGES